MIPTWVQEVLTEVETSMVLLHSTVTGTKMVYIFFNLKLGGGKMGKSVNPKVGTIYNICF